MKAGGQEVKKATPKAILPEWMEEMHQELEQTYLQAGAMMVVLRKIAGHCWKGYEAEDSLAKNECFSNILKEIETVPKDGRRYLDELNGLEMQMAKLRLAAALLIDYLDAFYQPFQPPEPVSFRKAVERLRGALSTE